MSQIVVNELSSLYLTFTFKDEAGVLVVPTTVDWRIDNIDDPHTPVEVVAWASLSPFSAINVQVLASDNAVTDQTRPYEQRVVTVRMDDGLSTMAHQKKRYKIRNLKGVS